MTNPKKPSWTTKTEPIEVAPLDQAPTPPEPPAPTPPATAPAERKYDADGRELDANGRRLDVPTEAAPEAKASGK